MKSLFEMKQAGEVDTDADPQSAFLSEMNQLNTLCCDLLEASGYNGSLLRKQLTLFRSDERQANITQPRSRERQDRMEEAKSQGDLFRATAGAALNDDDAVLSRARKALRKDIDVLEKTKKTRQAAFVRQQKALAIFRSAKPATSFSSAEYRDLIAWKIGRPCPAALKSKEQRQSKWVNELQNEDVAVVVDWSADDEAALASRSAIHCFLRDRPQAP
jgi:hypothetical protein